MLGHFPAVLNFNRLFLKLIRFVCNQLPVLPDHRSNVTLSDWGGFCLVLMLCFLCHMTDV